MTSESKNPALQSLLSLVGNRNTITVHRAVVDFAGSLETAILFEQLLYWLPKASDGKIAKTDNELMEETYLSRYALRKSRDELKERGLIEVDVAGFGGKKSTVYTPDMGAIEEAWASFVRNQTNGDKKHPINAKSDNHSSEIRRSNTETTTETLTSSEPNGSSDGRSPPTDAPFYALAELVFGIRAEEIPKSARQHVGRALKSLREVDPEIDKQEIRRFVKWWKGNKSGAHIPLDPAKMQMHFMSFKSNPKMAADRPETATEWRERTFGRG